MRPIIGITSDYKTDKRPTYQLDAAYAQAVFDAGGQPFIIPPLTDTQNVAEVMGVISGLVISGGDFDIDPQLYGETPHPKLGRVYPIRTDYEFALLRQAVSQNLPVLGICGGLQVINVAYGGTLCQDIPSQYPNHIAHQQSISKAEPSHPVTLAETSRLCQVMGQSQLMVNSTHHQAVKDVGNCLTAVAWAADGLVEAVELADSSSFVVGVQWHPEALYQTYPAWQKLFLELVIKAKPLR